ncbi:transposable element Tcb2 transposase [Trichonephila clavipes]|nr:transposable element Tcb2 transposase [Trichonephila clavipes]
MKLGPRQKIPGADSRRSPIRNYWRRERGLPSGFKDSVRKGVPTHINGLTINKHYYIKVTKRLRERGDFLGRRLAARTLPPVTIRELRLALQDEWALMPQQLIDTLILSMGRRCETCLAVRGDHISY